MKKSSLLVVVVFWSAVSIASSANWSFSAVNIYDGSDAVAAKMPIGTVGFLFDASILTQAKLFEIFSSDTAVDMTKVIGYVTTSSSFTSEGVLPGTSFSYGQQGGGDYNYYFAIINSDAIYLSATKTVTAYDKDTIRSITFGNQDPSSGVSSRMMTIGYESPGQWSQVSGGDVPEPTTCSLLLVGLAGMGLKRLRSRRRQQA